MRKLRFCVAVVAIAHLAASVLAQDPINTPILSTAPNFRDLAGISAGNGGTGFADTTSNGGWMRTGVFYRTDALQGLNATDWNTISSLNIRYDIDLRTPSEISGGHDWVPNGATFTNINIFGTPAPPPPDLVTTQLQAINYMRGMYQAFVADSLQRAKLQQVMLYLANTTDPADYHCSAGKDRTGWTSAVLQSIAGVPQAKIMQDYMATNNYLVTPIADLSAYYTALGQSYLIPIIDVRPEYLQASFDQVIAEYGSMENYLTRGLGLTQADIYVLRAKMVYYATLPGQSGMVGNAAAGAGLLNALQNSPLSGRYTAFNYYLQSAIDAGTLGGVETQVGGQVFADAAAYLFLQPVWLDWAIAPHITGRELDVGQYRFWLAGMGGYFQSDAHAGIARALDGFGGSVVGATYRLGERFCADLGIGYTTATVGSAGGSAQVDAVPVTLGGRLGFYTLDEGPFAAARADLGWADYQGMRALGGGLGVARGSTSGCLYSGRADLGDVIRLGAWTLTPQAGVRVTQATLSSLNEGGSELALNYQGISQTYSSVLADLELSLDPLLFRNWVIAPEVNAGYEQLLGKPQFASSAQLYNYTINQLSACNSVCLMKLGAGLTARYNTFTVTGSVNALRGDDASMGVTGQLSVGYGF